MTHVESLLFIEPLSLAPNVRTQCRQLGCRFKFSRSARRLSADLSKSCTNWLVRERETETQMSTHAPYFTGKQPTKSCLSPWTRSPPESQYIKRATGKLTCSRTIAVSSIGSELPKLVNLYLTLGQSLFGLFVATFKKETTDKSKPTFKIR